MEKLFEGVFSGCFTSECRADENGIIRREDDTGEDRVLDGDFFDETDIRLWRGGAFSRSLESRTLLGNPASRRLADEIVGRGCVIDLACGPGMGFIPSVKMLDPSLPCIASDANYDVMNEWRKFIGGRRLGALGFARFSLFDIPIRSGSVPAYSSFIGISSTREGKKGYIKALSEIRRTLSDDGVLCAVESEWTDIPAILRLFEKMGREPWGCFLEEQKPWHDRFEENGFDIIYEAPYEYRSLAADDNELGEAAERYGVDVGMKFTAFIVGKRG